MEENKNFQLYFFILHHSFDNIFFQKKNKYSIKNFKNIMDKKYVNPITNNFLFLLC